MSSSEEYVEYVMDLMSQVDDVSYRKMMGEYVVYASGKVIGGIYDDRFLIKITGASSRLLPDAELVSPYPGAKDMIVFDSENPEQIAEVINAMLPELPVPKPRKKNA